MREVPPVQSSPPTGTRIEAVGGHTVENDHVYGAAIELPGREMSSPPVTVAVYVVHGANGSCEAVRVRPSGDHAATTPVTSGARVTPGGGIAAGFIASVNATATNARSGTLAAPSEGETDATAGGVESMVKSASLTSKALCPRESRTRTRTRAAVVSRSGSVQLLDCGPIGNVADQRG